MILHVDPSHFMQELIRNKFSSYDVTVVSFYTSIEAIAELMYNPKQYSAVIMSGELEHSRASTQLIKCIKKLNTAIRIIICTGNKDEETKLYYQHLGVTGIVYKGEIRNEDSLSVFSLY